MSSVFYFWKSSFGGGRFRFWRKPVPSDLSRTAREIPVYGPSFEVNGWSLEIIHEGAMVRLIVKGTYGEVVFAETHPAPDVLDVVMDPGARLCLGDNSIGQSDIEWAYDIRIQKGHLIGYVGRKDFVTSLRALLF